MTKHRPAPAELLSFPSALALPEPLVPANVDLRDFPFMPIEVERLFGSEFHAQASDSEWRDRRDPLAKIVSSGSRGIIAGR